MNFNMDTCIFFQMHHVGFVDEDDMNVVSGIRKYSSLVGYSSSKLAQVKFYKIKGNNVTFAICMF